MDGRARREPNGIGSAGADGSASSGPSGIRRARPDEAEALTELALRSKGHWGYSPAFLEACRSELTVSPREIDDGGVYVVESEGEVAGFYRLSGAPPAGRLEDLFVDPAAIGRGLGRRLLGHAVATACRAGFRELEVEADPNAEAFYLSRGATRIGEVESPVQVGRMLPVLRIDLSLE
jgi:GNAT superfamily N-acetyltransferase